MCANMSWKTIKTVSVHWVWCLLIWLGLRRSFLLDLRRLQSSSSSCLLSAGALQTYGEADCDVAGREKKAWRKEAEMEERFFTRMLCWEEKKNSGITDRFFITFYSLWLELKTGKSFGLLKRNFSKSRLPTFSVAPGLIFCPGYNVDHVLLLASGVWWVRMSAAPGAERRLRQQRSAAVHSHPQRPKQRR